MSYTSGILALPSVPSTSSRAVWSWARLAYRVMVPSIAIVVVLLVTAATRLAAAEPNIYLIELLSSNLVTLHFETDANRTYSLQDLDSLSCPTNGGAGCSSYNVPTGSWSNLWVAPRLPFPNHYVYADYRTNRMRFYRLKVTP
jgi:hypothetical protein